MSAPASTPPDASTKGDTEECATSPLGTEDEVLAEIVANIAPLFAVTDPGNDGRVRTVSISFGRMLSDVTFPLDVEVRRVPEVLNLVAKATVEASLLDIQFWAQRRTTKSGAPEAIHGVVLDVDEPAADILGELERAGLPMPTAYFGTINGFKAVFTFAHAVNIALFEQTAKRLTLALAGADPASWSPSQGQRLPTCLKTTKAGVVPVNFAAQLANPIGLNPVAVAVPFPRRVLRLFGGWSPSFADREQIGDYLADKSIPAPEEPGALRYAACPVSEEHDSTCCYVNLREGGAIDITCLGGHGGEGKKHWSEREILILAGGSAAAGEATFDLLEDLPVTWAARELFEHKLRDWPPAHREAAFEAWMSEKALREAEGAENVDAMLSVYRQRLQGDRAFGPLRMYFSMVEQRLAYDDAAGWRSFVNCKEGGPSTKPNLHECQSTAAWTLVKTERKDGTFQHVPGFASTTSSLMNKVLLGQRSALRVLGAPALTRYDLPVAHVADGWDVESRTKILTATQTFVFPPEVKPIPALAFFLRLFHAGRLPLVSENDVRLLVACLAAPLLRDIGRGQLGIFWFIGPPGAGKDFLAEMVVGIWAAVSPHPLRVSFDISVTNDLETKRSFFAAEGAIFGRAKEAGKRLGMVEALIQVAGTNTLTARGMGKDERSIPNSFVILADSAEDLPDRREISRRTTMISLAEMDDTISKGSVINEVKRAAPGLLLDLMHLVESKPPEWYLGQTDTQSRLLIPVALARLLEATLPEVQGQDLSDVFEAMKYFIETMMGKEEGESENKKARERGGHESLEMKSLPSYRISFFIDEMWSVAGYRELFKFYGSTVKSLTGRITRESSYSAVRTGKAPYHVVTIGQTEYAFKLPRSNRNFIFVLREEYDQKVSSAKATTAAADASTLSTAGTPEASSRDNVNTTPAHGLAPARSDAPLVFSDDDLLNTDGSTDSSR